MARGDLPDNAVELGGVLRDVVDAQVITLRDARLVWLRAIGSASYAELSERYGVTVATVRKHHSRVTKRIARHVAAVATG